MARASRSARAWLSCRFTRANSDRLYRLNATTIAPTVPVTPRTCLVLIDRRMSGSGLRPPDQGDVRDVTAAHGIHRSGRSRIAANAVGHAPRDPARTPCG